ncbi:MAG: transposase [Pleurocapsa sp.]
MTSKTLVPNCSESQNRELETIEDPEKGLLLSPFQRKLLQKNLAKEELRPEYARRIKIMLLADLGRTQTEICKLVNCSQETARYWIFAAKTGQAHDWKRLSIGRPKRINEEYLNRLQELVNQSPRECGYAFTRWTANWLSRHLEKELGIAISDRHINRLLKKMGLSTREKQTETETNVSTKPRQSCNIVIADLSQTAQPDRTDFQLFPALNT